MKPDNTKINLNIDELLLFALGEIIAHAEQPNFENLVAKCFNLFPRAFGLKGYIDKYPDSSRVDKSWRRCRTDRKWIAGSVAHGFIVTSKGNDELLRIKAILTNNPKMGSDQKQIGDKRTKTGRIIEHIEKHPAYIKYNSKDMRSQITDFEVCDILFCSLDSFAATRKRNLEHMKELIKQYQRDDLIKFLQWLEENKSNLFNNQ